MTCGSKCTKGMETIVTVVWRSQQDLNIGWQLFNEWENEFKRTKSKGTKPVVAICGAKAKRWKQEDNK